MNLKVGAGPVGWVHLCAAIVINQHSLVWTAATAATPKENICLVHFTWHFQLVNLSDSASEAHEEKNRNKECWEPKALDGPTGRWHEITIVIIIRRGPCIFMYLLWFGLFFSWKRRSFRVGRPLRWHKLIYWPSGRGIDTRCRIRSSATISLVGNLSKKEIART